MSHSPVSGYVPTAVVSDLYVTSVSDPSMRIYVQKSKDSASKRSVGDHDLPEEALRRVSEEMEKSKAYSRQQGKVPSKEKAEGREGKGTSGTVLVDKAVFQGDQAYISSCSSDDGVTTPARSTFSDGAKESTTTSPFSRTSTVEGIAAQLEVSTQKNGAKTSCVKQDMQQAEILACHAERLRRLETHSLSHRMATDGANVNGKERNILLEFSMKTIIETLEATVSGLSKRFEKLESKGFEHQIKTTRSDLAAEIASLRKKLAALQAPNKTPKDQHAQLSAGMKKVEKETRDLKKKIHEFNKKVT
ncbi:hypothetical protein SAICODRAFT_22577 [Saitoella complicata NRRL Y-17804]|uniref:Uncharacterized protein n=1 Tax=Saitoella complicata (strain BCRC 22490 / CBS 7301 / JCM 7358 / NBRC 10748 / NRRL Y-17804) TaxID=698492 RepID=A0A0E9NDG1_SAICN|nr:uncharacterized protein SAICODRAFT_22577 [Saitoella complicata NRRL Y-17804]ODQ56170.1 hypothetical protein SAICODRAFT_22577 [Saitoella complicata NRRL Y-17804]GAO47864.1 hypothetical protein G7K_2060-t1 [Saitoella complicata NRRL Y-17804]